MTAMARPIAVLVKAQVKSFTVVQKQCNRETSIHITQILREIVMSHIPLHNQVRALSAGTICSISRDEPIFSQMDCSLYDNSERIHRAFSLFVQSEELDAQTWQEAWTQFLQYAQSSAAAARMRVLLTDKGFTLTASGEIGSWKDPNGNLAMLDAVTGVMASRGLTEPFVIQKGFFL